MPLPVAQSFKQAAAVSGALAASGAVLLAAGFLGVLDRVLTFAIGLPLLMVGIAALAIYRIKLGEPYRELTPKIPYLYLFMDMYLTAGFSANDALGKAAEMLDDKVLILLHRHLMAGYGHEEAISRVFNGFKGMARTYVENLLRSSLFGMGGVSFIRDSLSHLLAEKEKEIEKVTEQLSMITEIYTVAGVFAPLTAIAALAALFAFGSGGIDPELMAILVMLMSIVAMGVVALLAKAVIDRVRV